MACTKRQGGFKMFPLVYYSHTDYSDVWPLMFSQVDKYFPTHQKYLFSDNATADLESPNWTLIKYDDGLKYQQRMVHCLRQVPEEVILFHHEDMFLYDVPLYQNLNEIAESIKGGEIDIVKLICASYQEVTFRNITKLSYVFENPVNLKFAIQPSLCNKKTLEMVYDKTGGDTIWQFEAFATQTCSYFNVKTAMTYLPQDQKRGAFHWDSTVYPYFATAIIKGKWNFTDYEASLKALLEEKKIDYSIRGVV